MRDKERERLYYLFQESKCPAHFLDNKQILDTTDYLLANGVIVPPVSVGQKVWYIRGGYYNAVHKKPCEIEVTEINQKWHGKILDWGFIANGTRYRFSSIGKTVFLSQEEAEQKLQEGKG